MRARILTSATVLAVLFGLTALSHADDAAPVPVPAGNGTVSGKVTTADGAPAGGAMVRLMPTAPKSDTDKPSDADGAKKKKHEKGGLSIKADDQGVYKIENVPAGDYTVLANIRGTGHAQDKVTVVAGQTAEVNLQLEKAKKKNG